MSKYKTNQLTGALLDLAVAKADGVDAVLSDPHPNGSVTCVTFYGRNEDGQLDGRNYSPSEHWSDGGPIIEREQIPICPVVGGTWEGEYVCWQGEDDSDTKTIRGPTPLVAAMRCYVASKLGEEVEL